MKRAMVMAVAFAGLFALPADTNAAEPKKSQVSQSVLASLGLGGMQAMSDKEGMQVRGRSSGPLGNSPVVSGNTSAGFGAYLSIVAERAKFTVQVGSSAATGIENAVAAP